MMAKMVKLLARNSLSKSEVAKRLDLHHVTVANYIHALQRERVVYISEWVWGNNNRWVPKYEFNHMDEPDAKEPAGRTPKERRQVYADYRARKKHQRVLQLIAGPTKGAVR